MLEYAIPSAIGLAVAWPLFIERYLIRTRHYRIAVPNLPPAFSGLRIVQLSDLHYGFLMPLCLIRWVVNRTNRMKKDMVVCTGDYVLENNGHRQIDKIWPVLADLESPMGVFSVLGNHDHTADSARSLYWLEKTGQNLRGRVRVFERSGGRLWIAGGGDLWEDHIELDDLLSEVPENGCRIVLAHNPETADTVRRTRIDLMISGHTHGGQVKFPFFGIPDGALAVDNKKYTHGLITSETGIRVFISRGIGWGTFPARFNCFPEIAVLELVSEKETGVRSQKSE